MKKAAVLLSVLGIVCLSISSFLVNSVEAVTPSERFQVGFVDLQRALADSTEGAKAKDSYETEVKGAQKKLDEKKKELERMQESFKKQQESLNEEARLEKQEELLSVEKDLRRTFKDSEEQLRRKNAQIVGKLLKDIRRVVSEVGREGDFTLILEKGSQTVLYADNSIDITDKVIKKFNAGN